MIRHWLCALAEARSCAKKHDGYKLQAERISINSLILNVFDGVLNIHECSMDCLKVVSALR